MKLERLTQSGQRKLFVACNSFCTLNRV